VSVTVREMVESDYGAYTIVEIEGSWADVDVTVEDGMYGRRVVLNVDGKTVYDADPTVS
jgi:hypothetical protein